MANPASLTPNDLTQNGSIAQPAVQTVDTNGTINCATNKMDRLFLELVNLAANAITVTVKAGASPPALLALDTALVVGATGGGTDKKIFGPFESGRFIKADGTFDVNFLAAAGAPNLQVRVYRLPKQI
jgi:hypothetical protein